MRGTYNTSGANAGVSNFDPYGATLPDYAVMGTGSHIGYTGAMTDSNGLVYLNARYYDPGLGDFLSSDPLAGKTADPGSFNLYAYVRGNPIIGKDLSGKFVEFDQDPPDPKEPPGGSSNNPPNSPQDFAGTEYDNAALEGPGTGQISPNEFQTQNYRGGVMLLGTSSIDSSGLPEVAVTAVGTNGQPALLGIATVDSNGVLQIDMATTNDDGTQIVKGVTGTDVVENIRLSFKALGVKITGFQANWFGNSGRLATNINVFNDGIHNNLDIMSALDETPTAKIMARVFGMSPESILDSSYTTNFLQLGVGEPLDSLANRTYTKLIVKFGFLP